MNAFDIFSSFGRLGPVSWDHLVRWTVLAAAVLISKAMAATLSATRGNELLTPLHQDAAAIATPSLS